MFDYTKDVVAECHWGFFYVSLDYDLAYLGVKEIVVGYFGLNLSMVGVI